MRSELAVRFMRFVDECGPIPSHRPELGACWLWTGATMRGGRGKIRLNDPRRLEPAPRVAFYLHFGRWPTNLACHHCDNPQCVRWSHLFDGTHRDNMRDAVAKGRMRKIGMKGNAHPLHILTAADIPVIIARRKAGEFLRTIGYDYGVNYRTISSVVSGKTWAHLELKGGDE